jgi:hypothetical protein
VSGAALDPNSAAIIGQLASDGGFGSPNMDVSMAPLFVDCTSPRVPFTQATGYYSPDCGNPPATIPVPASGVGAIEGRADWTSR